MTIVSQRDIEQAIDDAFGADTPRTTTVHQSGAIGIVIRPADHFIVIDGTATQTEWGISVDPDDADAFTGHSVTAPSFAEALRAAYTTLHS
jgi:hypothetical protein